jgi:transcription antitermination factor NusG
MAHRWYVLQAKAHCEDVAFRQVQSQGFDAYYPSLRARAVNPRSRKIRPYFPGYLFVRTDLGLSGVSVFQWMPYSNGLVSFGGEPATVPDALIAGIQITVANLAESGWEWYDDLVPGDPVTIHAGPFAGYSAIFDTHVSGSERVRVLLQLLSGQTIALTTDAAQLESTKRR